MPSCIVRGCRTTQRRRDSNVSLHAFPNNRERIRIWLTQTGQFSQNLEEMVQKVLDGKLYDTYRICSLHFKADAYTYEEDRRYLRPDAIPTEFPPPFHVPSNITVRVDAPSSFKVQQSTASSEIFVPCHSTDTRTVTTVSYTTSTTVSSTTSSATYFKFVSSVLATNPLMSSISTNMAESSATKRTRDLSVAKSDVPFTVYPATIDSGQSAMNVSHGPDTDIQIPILQSESYSDLLYKKRSFATNTEFHKFQKVRQTQTYFKKKHRRIQVTPKKTDRECTISVLDPEDCLCLSSSDSDIDEQHSPRSKRTRWTDSILTETASEALLQISKENLEFTKVLGEGHSKIMTSTPVKATQSKESTASTSAVLTPMDLDNCPVSPVLEEESMRTESNLASESLTETLKETFTTVIDPSDETFHLSDEEEDPDEMFLASSENEVDEDTEFEAIFSECKSHAKEEKFLVFECSLRKLLALIPCQAKQKCNAAIIAYKKKKSGSMIMIHAKCANGHTRPLWETQPRHGKRPLGNILLSAAIILSGSSFFKVKHFLNILGMRSIGKSTHYTTQKELVFPAIDYQWQIEQKQCIKDLKRTSVCLTGDGQSDSPGFSAKYCVYSVMDYASKKICAFTVEQVVPPLSSVSLEKICFEKTVDFLIDQEVDIHMIATDRHVSIRKLMKEKYSNINHQFDVWHLSKSVGNKVLTASKTKQGSILSTWVQPIKNHMWFCAKTCGENGNVLVSSWKSLINHVSNVHTWKENNGEENSCNHPPLSQELENNTKWIDSDSTAMDMLKGIILNKNLLRDMQQLNLFCHTGELEIYHSVCLKYRPKRLHFFIDAMVARTQLAALDHNYNVNRVKAVVKHATASGDPVGTVRHRVEFSKSRKAWVVKALYEPTSQEFLFDIMENVLRVLRKELQTTWHSRMADYPSNIATVEKPESSELISQHQSRFSMSQK